MLLAVNILWLHPVYPLKLLHLLSLYSQISRAFKSFPECPMAQASIGRHSVRFAVFELDLDSGELRKHGIKIKLQQKPFQILSLLIERPGEVVTRAELQRRL